MWVSLIEPSNYFRFTVTIGPALDHAQMRRISLAYFMLILILIRRNFIGAPRGLPTDAILPILRYKSILRQIIFKILIL